MNEIESKIRNIGCKLVDEIMKANPSACMIPAKALKKYFVDSKSLITQSQISLLEEIMKEIKGLSKEYGMGRLQGGLLGKLALDIDTKLKNINS